MQDASSLRMVEDDELTELEEAQDRGEMLADRAKGFATLATPPIATYVALDSRLPLIVRIPAGIVAVVKGAPILAKFRRWMMPTR